MNPFPASVDRATTADPAATLARRAALLLACDADPSYPARVEALLRRPAAAREHARDALAAFLVAAAGFGARAEPASVATYPAAERYLRRHLGIDEGMAPDHERILAALAEALTGDAEG